MFKVKRIANGTHILSHSLCLIIYDWVSFFYQLILGQMNQEQTVWIRKSKNTQMNRLLNLRLVQESDQKSVFTPPAKRNQNECHFIYKSTTLRQTVAVCTLSNRKEITSSNLKNINDFVVEREKSYTV
jgi:hypothetical protein